MLLPPATASSSVPAASVRFAARSAAPAVAAVWKHGRVLLRVWAPRRGAPARRFRSALSFSTSAAPGAAEGDRNGRPTVGNAGSETGDESGLNPQISVTFHDFLFSTFQNEQPEAADATNSNSGASDGAGEQQSAGARSFAEPGRQIGREQSREFSMQSSEYLPVRNAWHRPPRLTVRWSPEVAEEAKELLARGSFGLPPVKSGVMTKFTRKGEVMSEAEMTVRAAELPSVDPERARQLAEMYASSKRYVPIPKVLRKYMKPLPRAPEDEKRNILRNNAGLFLVRFPTYELDWTWFRPWMNGCPPLSPDELRKKNDVDLNRLEFFGGDYSANMEGFPRVAVNEKLIDEIGLQQQLHDINLTLNANPTLTTAKRREMKRRIFEVVGACAPKPVGRKEIRKNSKVFYRFWRPRHHQRPDFPYNRRVPAWAMARALVAKARAAARAAE